MSTFESNSGPDVFTFRAKTIIGASPGILVGGRVSPSGWMVTAFLVALRIHASFWRLEMETIYPGLVVFVGSSVTAWRIGRSPQLVEVSNTGLILIGRSRDSHYTWDQVGWAKTADASIHRGPALVIYDATGRALATLSHAFTNFDLMVKVIREHLAGKKDRTAEHVQRKKSRQMAAIIFVFGLAMLADGVFIGFDTYSQAVANQLMQTKGVSGMGKVVRRFVAPDGVTLRLEYTITTKGRSATHNAEVTREVWEMTSNMNQVPVIYVPKRPELTHLLIGEVQDSFLVHTSAQGYAMSIGALLFGMFALGGSILIWSGWDIVWDAKTRRLVRRRYGEAT